MSYFQSYHDVSRVTTGFFKRTKLSSWRVFTTPAKRGGFALVKCDLPPTAEVSRELYIIHGISPVLFTLKKKSR